jgi:hypothetical protein
VNKHPPDGAIKNPVGVGETYRVRREENRQIYYVVITDKV